MNLGAFQPGQAAALPTSTIELAVRFVNKIFLFSKLNYFYFSCEALANTDVLSKSDPVCVLHIKGKAGEWLEYGRT